MKSHSDNQNLVTKDFLKLELSDLKNELQGELGALEKRLGKKLDNVTNMLVDVAGQLQDMREENTIGTHQIKELRTTSGDHEKRISKLEIT
jgi:hypothetical protein